MPLLNSKKAIIPFMLAGLLLLVSCSGRSEPTLLPTIIQDQHPTINSTSIPPDQNEEISSTPEEINEDSPVEEEQVDEEKAIRADVISVTASGQSQSYQFSVEISSPDTGCEQFADWWEILSEDGELIYRRILLHSHVNEQPFTRSGGPVDIEENTVVYIRAHMNQAGYRGMTMKGSAESGFISVENPPDFSTGIENEPPLPTGCNF